MTRMDSPTILMHHPSDPSDLGSLILMQIIPKERTLSTATLAYQVHLVEPWLTILFRTCSVIYYLLQLPFLTGPLPVSKGQLPSACYWVPTNTLGWSAVELEPEDLMIQAEELMVPLHSSHLNLTTP